MRESRFDDVVIGPDDVLTFWLGPPDAPPLSNSTKWYKKDEAFDREVIERFTAAHDLASRGALDDRWKTTPRGKLALVILLDQLSRNMYRNKPRAFAQDARACDTTLETIASGEDTTLTIVERSFLYMPLMHSEDVESQRKGLATFDRLTKDAAGTDLEKHAASYLDYMKKHADIVERFGRFPHRNIILGRTSTSDELEFLKQPGSAF